MLDVRKIAQRRRALGLTRIDVAAALRTSKLHINALEDDGRDSELRLAQVMKLADVLSWRPEDLVAMTERPAPTSKTAALASVLLNAHPDPIAEEDLCRTLGWPVDQLHDIARELARGLPAFGQVLVASRDTLAIAADPDALTPGERDVIASTGPTEEWSELLAKTLWAVIERLPDEQWLNAAEPATRQALRQLVAAGHVVMHRGEYRPSDHLIIGWELRSWETLADIAAAWGPLARVGEHAHLEPDAPHRPESPDAGAPDALTFTARDDLRSRRRRQRLAAAGARQSPKPSRTT